MRLLVGLLLLLLVAVPVAGLVLFVRPSTGEVGEVDAVVALAGEQHRLRTAVDLVEAGHARVLVLSYGPASICRDERAYEVICFVPEPPTTAGEAAEVGRLTEERGWDEIAVVTATYHVTRARRSVARCTDAAVTMVDAGSAFRTNRSRLDAIWHEVQGLVGGIILRTPC